MIIRCRSKSNLDRYHTITVTGPGQVRCSENGAFCAHIDAVMNYGLIAVVHPDDQHLVKPAQDLCGPVPQPKEWKAAWMRDGTWIAGRLSRPSRSSSTRLPTDKPGVCFSGTDPARGRKELSAEAEAHGWTPTSSVTSLTQILVLADKSSTSTKAIKALKDEVPICDYQEWREEVTSPCWTRG